jgi:hypothetical protein
VNPPAWHPIAKLLIGLGALFICLGLFWQMAGKYIALLPIGRLPGDIHIERDHFKFYFPLTTCLLISFTVSAVMKLILYFRQL